MTPALLAPKTTLKVRGPLTLRAAFQPETFQVLEGGNPTVRLIASAGAAVRRAGWFDGGFEEFDELLSFEAGAHRDERLASGRVNLLLDHDRFDVRQVFGVLADPVWDRAARTLTLTARLSRRPDHAGLVQDVRDGILVNTSIGYRTFRTRDITTRESERRQIEAIDWETREVSLVSVGADPGSHVRTHEPEDSDGATIVVLSSRREEPMPNEPIPTPTPAPVVPVNTPADQGRGAPAPTPTPAPTPAPAPAADAERAAEGELTRQRTIRDRLRAAHLSTDDEFARGLLDSRAVTPDVASSRILERLATQDAGRGTDVDGHVRIGDEEGATLSRSVEDAILFRTNQAHFIDGVGNGLGGVDRAKLGTRLQGNPFLHRSLMEVGEEFVSRVFNVRNLARMPKKDRAGMILRGRISEDVRSVGSVGVGHSTSDFPGILANVVNKVLRGTFELTPETYSQWTNRGTLGDYKVASRVQLGHAPRLLQVREGAEYTYATVGEQNEPIVLAKYGRIVSFTREAMINDDLDAFSRLPRQYGAAARQLIADLVYLHLTGNTLMSDGLGIFHATHANLVTGVGNSLAAAGVAALSNLRTLASLQTSIPTGLAGTGNEAYFMAVQIQHLRVPPQLQTAAEQLTTLIQAQTVGNVNPFQGEFRSVMAEPRLSASSALAFYGMADPSMLDTVEVAFLQGEDGPMVESRIGFERDGMDVKVRLDVATAPTDFRGLYKNEGTV